VGEAVCGPPVLLLTILEYRTRDPESLSAVFYVILRPATHCRPSFHPALVHIDLGQTFRPTGQIAEGGPSSHPLT